MFRISTNPCLKFESFASENFTKKNSKIFGRALGRPAPPRPAGPAFLFSGREQEGMGSRSNNEARDKGAGTHRARGRPCGPREAGRLLSSAHVPSPPTVAAIITSLSTSASTWSNGHRSGGRSACPRPAGLASVRGYKSQPGRRSSVH